MGKHKKHNRTKLVDYKTGKIHKMHGDDFKMVKRRKTKKKTATKRRKPRIIYKYRKREVKAPTFNLRKGIYYIIPKKRFDKLRKSLSVRSKVVIPVVSTTK